MTMPPVKEHSQAQGLSELVEVTSNEANKDYFERLKKVSSSLIKICEGQVQQNRDSVDDITTLKYLHKLNNSIRCMRMKYWFNGSDFAKQSSLLLIDAKDSGFPIRKEFHELSNDIKRADSVLESLEPIEALKKKQLDYLISHKRINREIQFDIQAHEYFKLVKNSELFMPDNKPVFIPANKAENGNNRYLVHWANFDITKNIPIIYIFLIEYSGKKKLEEEDFFQDLYADLESYSSSSYKLLSICTDIDKKYNLVHPKSLKRICVGPLYINGFTKHNRHVTSALEYVAKHHPDENWLFGYTVESLYSKTTMKTDAGLFKSSQQKEIYYIDTHNPDSVEYGCSDREKSMVIPYTAYQHLADQEENALNNIQKYVVRNEGEVIYL